MADAGLIGGRNHFVGGYIGAGNVVYGDVGKTTITIAQIHSACVLHDDVKIIGVAHPISRKGDAR